MFMQLVQYFAGICSCYNNLSIQKYFHISQYTAEHLTISLRACSHTQETGHTRNITGGEFNSLGFVIQVSHWSLCHGKTFLTNIITGKKPPND